MRYRLLGNTGVKISPLCLGTMNFGNEAWGCDEATSAAILDRYLELGGNFVDTANVYAAGVSESILGRALESRRDDVVLATKGYFPLGGDTNRIGNSRRNLREQLESSLERLGTDWVDLYQVHIYDPLTPVDETLRTLSEFVREGLVHYIGCCNYTGWQLAQSIERARGAGLETMVTVQPQYNLLCRDIEVEVMPAADAMDVGILAWSPLAFGMLAGKYDRQSFTGPRGARLNDLHEEDIMTKWKQRYFTDRCFDIVDAVKGVAEEIGSTPVAVSLRWVLEQPAVSSVIIGPRNVAQLEGCLEALEIELEEDQLERLEDASAYPENYLEFMQGGTFARRVDDLD
jgi:aryl-alcohol dehydrogenase-like predicted oxidoreductase